MTPDLSVEASMAWMDHKRTIKGQGDDWHTLRNYNGNTHTTDKAGKLLHPNGQQQRDWYAGQVMSLTKGAMAGSPN
jgi:hypothetical protein